MSSLRNNRSWKIYLNCGDYGCNVRIGCREREFFLMDSKDWCRESLVGWGDNLQQWCR